VPDRMSCAREAPAAAVINDKILIIGTPFSQLGFCSLTIAHFRLPQSCVGGHDGMQALSSVEEFNPLTNEFTQRTPMRQPRHGLFPDATLSPLDVTERWLMLDSQVTPHAL
jgi:hypothetical protein